MMSCYADGKERVMSNFKKFARRKYVINEPRKRTEPQIWKPYKAKKRSR